jgi:hypothetical protein
VGNFGPEYTKINSAFKRDMGNNGVIIPGDFAQEEFEFLQDNPWVWTEKIDGTNIRLHYDGESITVGGRTDAAQIPGGLLYALAPLNNPRLWAEVFPADPAEADFPVELREQIDVTVYGEGYGPKIQKNGHLYRSEPGFIVFDIRVGPWWLKRDAVADIATKLGLDLVPYVGVMTLNEAIAAVKSDSIRSAFPFVKPEGLVGTPLVPLRTRRGDRIVVKLKGADFAALAMHNQRLAARAAYEQAQVEALSNLVAAEVIPADIAAEAADFQPIDF